MLKKLRCRFILIGMLAFAAVAVLLILSINLINYYRTTAQHDEVLQGIHEYNLSVPAEGEARPPISDMPWNGRPGGEFTLRFFSIQCNDKGELQVFDNAYISSIDEETAEEYTHAVLDRHEASGYYLDYRYLVTEGDNAIEIIFLNVADANDFRHMLLIISCAVGGIGLLLAFFLITLFSGQAIRPYVKNLEQQKRFITDAGHELKTPVTSISTSADILALENENNEWIENIQKQTVHLSKLIGDLVLLSRMDEAQPFREAETFSLSEAVWEIFEHFQSQALGLGKTYQQEIEENITCTGDKSAIQQLLSVLLDNAIRYSDDKGLIRLTLKRKHGRPLIECYNTCDHLPEGDLERLFDRFYRPDESRSKYTGGSGIGLSIARAIAQKQGGTITVTPDGDKAILFTVTI